MDPLTAWALYSAQREIPRTPTRAFGKNKRGDGEVRLMVRVRPLGFDPKIQWFSGSMGWRFEGPESRTYIVVRIFDEEALYVERAGWFPDWDVGVLDFQHLGETGYAKHACDMSADEAHKALRRLHPEGGKKWISERIPRR